MSALGRKLLRDLLRLTGQAITIALVVAAGIAAFVSLRSTYRSLLLSRDAYYERERLADVFAHLERAPLTVRDDLLALPGVALVEPRIVAEVRVPLPGIVDPPSGRVVSLPPDGRPALNRVHLRSGRFPDPVRHDEVVVIESFASSHGLAPGDRIVAIVRGTELRLRIVGIGMSPEHVLPVSEGDITSDPARFVALWMTHDALAAALAMEGAFNDVSLKVQPGARPDPVARAVERVLEPYGCFAAVTRARQISNYVLEGELSQLEGLATIVPFIFLGVAAFLLNVVLSRLVQLQRTQIATLKAVGYSDLEVGLHYLVLVSLIVFTGSVVGVLVGRWLGEGLAGMYAEFFRFPTRLYRLDFATASTGVAVSLLSAVVGAFQTVRSVALLPPAQAMQPPPPATYHAGILERLGLLRLLGPSGGMIVRELSRKPLRTIVSSLGIGAAVAIVIVGRFSYDSLEGLLDLQFQRSWREDVAVSFFEPVPARAARELAHLPGVHRVEALRVVPVRFAAGPHFRDAVIYGYPDPSTLRRLLDREGRVVEIPRDGVVLTSMLANILDLRIGDRVRVEVREGDRRAHDVVVTGLVDEPFGLQGHMSIGALGRMMHERETISLAVMRVDPHSSEDVLRRLRRYPGVLGVTRKAYLLERFRAQTGEQMATFNLVLSVFASVIAVGVVYNDARVALANRARDLASLRVLGFTRAEISSVLLGEQAVQVLLGIPLGFLLGTWWAHAVAASIDPEAYRMPIVIAQRTYAYAAVIAIVSAAASALLVRRRLDHLDLVAVLKTRE